MDSFCCYYYAIRKIIHHCNKLLNIEFLTNNFKVIEALNRLPFPTASPTI